MIKTRLTEMEGPEVQALRLSSAQSMRRIAFWFERDPPDGLSEYRRAEEKSCCY
jgi:hypothetical protein